MTSLDERSSRSDTSVTGTPRSETDGLRQWLRLEPAGVHSWRVCDGRVSHGQGRFLAFIEEKNELFEVMQLGDDFVWTSFTTIDDALTHIVQTAEAYVIARPDRDFAWIK